MVVGCDGLRCAHFASPFLFKWMPSLSLAPKCGKAVALLEGGIRHDMPAIQPRSQRKPEGRERSKGNPQGGAAVVQLGVTYEEPSLPTSTGRQRWETRRKGVAHLKRLVATRLWVRDRDAKRHSLISPLKN